MSKKYWSYSAEDAAAKANQLSSRRTTDTYIPANFTCSPQGTQPPFFLSFGHPGKFVATPDKKSKLAPRAHPACYLCATTPMQHLELSPPGRQNSSVRPSSFQCRRLRPHKRYSQRQLRPANKALPLASRDNYQSYREQVRPIRPSHDKKQCPWRPTNLASPRARNTAQRPNRKRTRRSLAEQPPRAPPPG